MRFPQFAGFSKRAGSNTRCTTTAEQHAVWVQIHSVAEQIYTQTALGRASVAKRVSADVSTVFG